MATITASDFRNGKTFEYEGKPVVVVEFQHVKPGKGAAFVRTKMKNLITGAVTETSFNPTATFAETYEQEPVSGSKLGDNFRFVKENMICVISSYKGDVFSVEPPNFVELEITDTDPGFAGNTATNTLKPATLETGAEIKVPLFINVGDRIRIDTRTGEYLERAKG